MLLKPRTTNAAPRRGAIAAEFALTLPLLLTLLLGIWDLGRLLDVNQILSNAAREGGRQASTGKASVAHVQQAVLGSLTQAGVSTTGASVTVTNVTDSSRSDPVGAHQLDQFRITATLPSNNVRWVILNNLMGPQQLQASCIWSSMRDIPLAVPTSIPIN